MRIIISGTPGTGKTTIAKALARKLKCKYLNEHEFCKKNKIGKIERSTAELVVPIPELQSALWKLLKREKNIVLEGHLLCEVRLPVDFVIVLECDARVLEKRLRKKRYSEEKILDNLYCESIGYCREKAKKNFAKAKLLRVDNSKGIKKSLLQIIRALKEQENR